ncbi:MAG: hypothetical protein AMXMBFR25_21320 [Lysobacterales bacterium]|nr:hypothetical protein [Xanthomonadales bacterium]
MRTLLSLVLLLCVSSVLVAQERPYTEGPVSVVTAVKIHDGQFDNYMDYLAKSYKPVLEAQKKAGLVVAYAMYTTQARNPKEPDMYLVVTYANMAAFDGLDDKAEAVAKSVTGQDRATANTAYADRGKMRAILGSELIREMVLK